VLAVLLTLLLPLGGSAPARAAPGPPGNPGTSRAAFTGPAASPTSRPQGSFRWPLDGTPPVVRPFVPPPTPYGRGHRGVDLGSSPGAVVRAAGPGVVTFAGPVAGRGVVVVRHRGGLRTTYEPVVVRVTTGTTVEAGDRVGILAAGHAGCPAAACLHWGLLRGRVYLDPLALLGLGPVRLWPLQPGDAAEQAATGLPP
jgi:murein DD-endopeptidase MepM/ murein hydrolase activator NlpD